MRSFLYRAAGILLALSALAGIVFSAVGIWGVWKLKPGAEAFLTDTTQMAVDGIDLMSATLDDVSAALEMVNEGLQSVNGVKDNLVSVLTSLTPVLDLTSAFVGEDLVLVMDGLQGSLDTLESGMGAVESTLSFLTEVPLLGSLYSGTAVSMTDGVEEMSTQVDALSTQLERFQGDLSDASTDLAQMNADLQAFAQTVDEADLSLQEQLDAVEDYQRQLTSLRKQLLDFRERWLRNILRIAIGSTVVFSWLAVLMICLLVFSMDLVLHGDLRQRQRELEYSRAAVRQTLAEEWTPQMKAELLAELRAELGLPQPLPLLPGGEEGGEGYPLPR